ncbi:MAG: hypothetical protein GSR72_04085 [Desulfurococcales archaeon]|nr:hypothetical protein [Desulfurococcales archaeon]
MLKDAKQKLSIITGVTAPIKAIVSPKRYFSGLGKLLDTYGIYAKAIIYTGSWIGASMITFLLLLLIELVRSILSIDIAGFLTSPLKAFLYSFAFPIVAVVIDATIIALLLIPFPRKRGILDVYVIRSSSLLPYALRVVVLEVEGSLSLASLVSATSSIISLILLVIGTILTIYGLRRTMGVNLLGATIAGSAPLIYKILLATL